MVLLVLLRASFNPLVFIHYCSGKRSNFTVAEYFYPSHPAQCKSTSIFLSFTPSSVQKLKHISVLHTQFYAKAQVYFCPSRPVLCKSSSIYFLSFTPSSVQRIAFGLLDSQIREGKISPVTYLYWNKVSLLLTGDVSAELATVCVHLSQSVGWRSGL